MASSRGPFTRKDAMRKVALVTWKELPALSDDDRLLLPELEKRGIVGVPAVWSDPGVKWEGFDAAIIRSTWDYHLRHREFLAWVNRVASRTHLWNPQRVIGWNSHKSYLKDLEASGLPVIPTRVLPHADSARRAMEREGWSRSVLKPAVSAGAHRTFLLEPGRSAHDREKFAVFHEGEEALLQPYVEAVEREGEHSLVFLGGKYSHAFLRTPKLAEGSRLSEGAPLRPSDHELEVAQRALSTIPEDLLYGRVDLVQDRAETPQIMEIELIEPALHLGTSLPAAADFARAIRTRL